jgi:hypothetical protein
MMIARIAQRSLRERGGDPLPAELVRDLRMLEYDLSALPGVAEDGKMCPGQRFESLQGLIVNHGD